MVPIILIKIAKIQIMIENFVKFNLLIVDTMVFLLQKVLSIPSQVLAEEA